MPVGNVGTSGRFLNVFYGATFTCNGWVQAWEFYAVTIGTFFAGVWEQTSDPYKYLQRGFNQINVTQTGLQRVDIPFASMVWAMKGYVIGIHYAEKNGDGIVPYVTSSKLCCNVTSSDLYYTYHKNMQNVPVGYILTIPSGSSKTKTVALRPVLYRQGISLSTYLPISLGAGYIAYVSVDACMTSSFQCVCVFGANIFESFILSSPYHIS